MLEVTQVSPRAGWGPILGQLLLSSREAGCSNPHFQVPCPHGGQSPLAGTPRLPWTSLGRAGGSPDQEKTVVA